MQRRDFLQLAATVSACALTQTGRAAEFRSRIRVGQIGTAHAHASGQMQTLRQLSDWFEVVGYVEPDQQKAISAAKHPVYKDLPRLTEEQLLNISGLKIVAVETAVSDLLPTAQRCVEAGMHIHLDKPAGESLTELEKLHQRAAEQSLIIQMGYMFRYNPAFQFLFRAVEQGWLGEIFEIHGVMSKKVGAATRKELAEYPGGSMFELGCHLVDPLLKIMGTPDNVTPFNRKTVAGDPLLDNTLAVVEYPQATATLRSTLLEVDGGNRRQFVVCGDGGTIAIKPLEAPLLKVTLETARGEYLKGAQTVKLSPSPGRYHGAWLELARAVQGEIAFPYSPEHDLAVQKTILAASGLLEWS